MEALDEMSIPLPSNYFDIICGTEPGARGGVIAIMLGRLQMVILLRAITTPRVIMTS